MLILKITTPMNVVLFLTSHGIQIYLSDWTIYSWGMCYYQYERRRIVSDIQFRIEGERLYVRYNTDANIVKYLWHQWM